MKKILRFIGILILVLIVAVVIMGLIAPRQQTLERSILINGSKDVVANQMIMFENWENWNPWSEKDLNIKSSITGQDGTPGAKYTWEGNDDVGAGEMINKDVQPYSKTYTTHFLKPWESTADGYYRIEEGENGQTKAVWGFTSETPFPMNGFFMLMKGALEKDFDKGLANLKKLVESGKANMAAATPNNFKIEEKQFSATTYATIRKTIAWPEMEKFFTDSYNALGEAAGQRITGNPVGIYYEWDEKNMKADAAAGFPLSGTEAVKGATMVNVPQTTAYMIAYKGGYAGSGKAHEAMGRHLAQNGKQQSMVIEEYVVGPGQEADSNKYVTNIYYILK